MNDEFVSTRECSVCRNNADKQEGINERRLNKHSDEIQDLTRISDQLTQLMSSMVDTQNKMDKRLEAIEKSQLEMQVEREANEKAQSKKPRWYETKIGEWTIKMCVLLLIFIIGAAIGQDLIPDIVKVVKGGN